MAKGHEKWVKTGRYGRRAEGRKSRKTARKTDWETVTETERQTDM